MMYKYNHHRLQCRLCMHIMYVRGAALVITQHCVTVTCAFVFCICISYFIFCILFLYFVFCTLYLYFEFVFCIGILQLYFYLCFVFVFCIFILCFVLHIMDVWQGGCSSNYSTLCDCHSCQGRLRGPVVYLISLLIRHQLAHVFINQTQATSHLNQSDSLFCMFKFALSRMNEKFSCETIESRYTSIYTEVH